MTDRDRKPENVIDLAQARAERSIERVLERRRAEPRSDATVGWTVDGKVVLHLDDPEWEVTWPLTVEQAAALISELQRYRLAAQHRRNVNDGFVRAMWCRVDGSVLWNPTMDGVPCFVTGRVPGAVHLRYAPETARGEMNCVREPTFGWPATGLYRLDTGAHIDTPERRQHWRIVERDLRVLRELDIPVSPPIAPASDPP